MSIDVARIAGLMAGATTLSLFTTIVALAAVQGPTLRWDGTFCTARHCPAPVHAAGIKKQKQALPQSIGGNRA